MRKSNHDLQECKECYVPKQREGCRVYTCKNNVMLNDDGECYSKVDSQEEWAFRLARLKSLY